MNPLADPQSDEMESLLREFGRPDQVESARAEKEAGEELELYEAGELVKDFPHKPQRELDLHGLNVSEAQPEVSRFVDECRRQSLRTVRIVTGRGVHSENFKAVLPSAVEKQLSGLRKEGRLLTWKMERNGGAFLVYLV